MAEKKSYIYEIIVDTQKGTASINGTDIALKKLSGTIRKLTAESKNLNENLGQGIDKTGLAGAAVVELGRTISDSNYGMTAMANNISQLSTLMLTLVSTTGGVVAGFKALISAFWGPLGIIVLFQAFIARMEAVSMEERALGSAADSARESLDKLKTSTTEYLGVLDRTNLSDDERLAVMLRLRETNKDINDLVDKNKGSLSDLREEIEHYIEVQGLRIEMDQLVVTKAEQSASMQELAKLHREQDVDGMRDWMAENEGMWWAWLQKITDRVAYFTDEQISNKVKGLLNVMFNEVTGTNNALDDTIKKLGELGDKYNSKDGKGKKRGKISPLNLKSPKELEEDIQRRHEQLGKELAVNESIEDQLQAQVDGFENDRAYKDMAMKAAWEVRGREHQDALTAIQIAGNKEREKDDKIAFRNKILLLEAIGSGLDSLGYIVGEATQEGKAIAAAGALIDTFAAITAQLKNASKIGLPGPIAIAQAVATGLFGFAQVKKIYSVKVPGKGGGGAGAGAVPSDIPIQQPDFNIVGVTRGNQIQRTITDALGKPIRAYVTTKDIRSSGELDRNIVRGATVG